MYPCHFWQIIEVHVFLSGFGGTGLTTGLNLATMNPALGGTGGLGGTSADLAAALLQQQQQVQQHLQVLNASPYGDSPLFRNLKQVKNLWLTYE